MYKTLSDYNQSQGLISLLQAASDGVSDSPWHLVSLPFLILSAVWIILSFGSFYAMSRRYGKGDLQASINAGGFTAVILAGLMSLIPNFISMRDVIIIVVLEICAFIWLWISREENL